jgi:O-methyltransferase
VACAASFLIGHVSTSCGESQGSLEFIPQPTLVSRHDLPLVSRHDLLQSAHSSHHDLSAGEEFSNNQKCLLCPSQCAQVEFKPSIVASARSTSLIAELVQPATSCQSAEIVCLQGDACINKFPIAAGLNGISDIQLLKHVKPFTMVPPGRLAGNLAVVRYIASANIPGDLVETGVARGGSAASMALATLLANNPRRLHLYDTFAGLPPADIHRDGAAAMEWTGKINHGVDEVTQNLRVLGVPVEQMVIFHARDILQTPANEIPCRISYLRIDTDWAASYDWAFQYMYPHVSPGGVVMLDDYGFWKGSRDATDAFLARPENAGVKLIDVAPDGKIFCKPFPDGRPCLLEKYVSPFREWTDIGR